jgi:Peptidase family M1 domain
VTKVLEKTQVLRTAVFCLALCTWPVLGTCAQFPAAKPGEALYLELGKVGLDPARVYQVRGASLDRSSIQISLDDGTIAFTRDVMGRITGAFFQGDGEILLTPPSEVERKSMSFFTGMAILEERFETAYFRFNDDAFEQLRPDLRDTNDKQEFIQRWDSTAKNLASGDAMRLLVSFSQMLPVNGTASPLAPAPGASTADRFLHARLQGTKLGVFDVFFDSTTAEQVQAGQARNSENGETYYDVWTSFAPLQTKTLTAAHEGTEAKKEKTYGGRILVRDYTIRTEVLPPKQIRARARLQCDVREGESRTLLFELSRFLQIESVTLDGNPVEFIHNPAIEGTQLSRRGNDIVAIVLPEPARSGQKFELDFTYAGEVLAEAGSGLLYVGEHGTWYPNRGMEVANFDLQFTYPQGWTLVATGKPEQVVPDPAGKVGEGQTSRWVSERPIPLAGFNLGKYREATTRAGGVTVETYATVGVERNFPSGEIEVVEPMQPDPNKHRREVITPAPPSPARNEVRVGEAAARAIQYFSDRFGPFPYSHLALTQMPGNESQGWPGLIFLSSYAFLTDEERKQLHYEESRILLQHLLPAHETAHQWWGDLVTWSSYRDQWFSEGLAHYCALMMLQERDPAGFREIMENIRHELVAKNKDGLSPMEAGPVTLGMRLLSSRSPLGYEAINYGRGAWLFHMLRTMLKDGAQESAPGAEPAVGGDEPFVRALRKIRQRYEGKAITTSELLDGFAEELPPSLWYEGKRSLDWFLEGWINGTSLPRLELRGVRFSPKGTGFVVSGTILQKGAPQELVTSIPLYGVGAGRQPIFLGRVFADGDESTFRLSAPAGTHKILIDPYETVLTAPKQ